MHRSSRSVNEVAPKLESASKIKKFRITGADFGGKFGGKNALGGMNRGIEKSAYVRIRPLATLTNSMIFNNSYILQLHKNSDSIPPYSIWRSNAAFT